MQCAVSFFLEDFKVLSLCHVFSIYFYFSMSLGKTNFFENYIKYDTREAIDPKTVDRKWRRNLNNFGRNSKKF